MPLSTYKKIVVDTESLDFDLTSQYVFDQNVLSAQNLTDETGSIGIAAGFFKDLNSYPKDIDETKTKTRLFTIAGGQLVPATSLSSAQIIRVDFYQQDRSKRAMYYPHYPN